MKKYITKKNIFIAIILIFSFFAVFKYMKGKSLFDTILEYSNSIYSINADVEEFDFDIIKKEKKEYIPFRYSNYIKNKENTYIVTKNDRNNLYEYNIDDKSEKLVVKIKEEIMVKDIKVDDGNVVWSQVENSIDENGVKKWSIFLKTADEEKILVDTGVLSKDGKLPNGINIDGDFLVYRRYDKEEFKEKNIKSENLFSSIILYDLRKKVLKTLDTTENSIKEIVYMPKISGDNVAWQKIYKDAVTDEINKTVINIYNTVSNVQEKKYETSRIKDFDIDGNRIVIVSTNPSDNINIINLKNESIDNILYKGSKFQKKFNKDDTKLDIIDVDFVSSKYILVEFLVENNNYNILYDTQKQLIYDMEKHMEKVTQNSGGFYYEGQTKLYLEVGLVKVKGKQLASEETLEIAKDKLDIYLKENELTDIDKVLVNNFIEENILIAYKIEEYTLR